MEEKEDEWFSFLDTEVKADIESGMTIKEFIEKTAKEVKWHPIYSIKLGLFTHYFLEKKGLL